MMSVMVRSPFPRVLAFVAVGAIAAACGSTSEPKIPPRDNAPATITSTTTGALAGQVGNTINTLLSVVVKNKAGLGADTALVTFAVTSGGGTVSNTTVRTDTTGVASTTWTLGGTAGTQTVTATVGTLPAVTFTATATAGTQTTFTKVASADNQTALVSANVATAPTVKVADKFGNPVAGVLVTFAANNGGSVTGGTPTTDAAGLAAVGSWKLGPTVGTNTLTATAAGIATPLTWTATGTVGAVSRVNITSAAIPTLSIGQTSTVTAVAFDANNNPIANPGITFASSNVAVATVNATTGLVTAVGSGTATITASANGQQATTAVTVIGHPTQIVVEGTVAMGSRIRNVVIAANTAYAALSSTGAVKAIELGVDTVAWTLALGGGVTGVAVDAANTRVTAVNTGAVPQFYYISPTTHLATDSIPLTANPVRMVMTSNGTRALVDENTFQVDVIDVPGKAVTATTSVGGTVTSMIMGPGDTVAYIGTQLGLVFEVNALTGLIKRQFQPSNTTTDVNVSRNGKTLYVADGTSNVFMISLATGGLSGTLDFGTNINGIAETPDGQQLWAAGGTQVIAAPFSAGDKTWVTNLASGRLTVAGTNLTKIVFTQNGTRAVIIDDAGLNLVVVK